LFSKKSILHILSILLLFLIVNSSASAQQINAAIDNSFTYQGKLTANNEPANGSYDFEFRLYDALTNGSQVGSTFTKSAVTVTDGLFSVQLNFGEVFDGSALYLEIRVREAGAGSYTTLDPRQALTAAPYALYSLEAGQADTAQDFNGELAGDVTGEQDETVVTALQNQPLVDTVPNTGQVLKYNGTQWQPDADVRHDYQGLIVVAKSGGDFNTITAALNSITDASDSNRYLVWVAPGTYAERVTMKSYVDIEGAGVLTTKISYPGSDILRTGTLIGANDAELRSLTVENTGGNDDDYAIAIYNDSTSPRLTNIIISASNGAFAYGVNNEGGEITMKNVSISAAGRIDSVGVKHYSCDVTTMTDVDISATGSTNSFGVETYSCPIILKNVNIVASGSTNSYGVKNSSSDAIINHSEIIAVYADKNYGIYNEAFDGSFNVTINHSKISGSMNTIFNASYFTTRVGASQLSGGDVSGTITCAGVYDENYTFYASTCP
jgi:hypothetical protein